MQDGIHTKRLTRSRWARPLAAAVLLGIALAAGGCGGSSSPGVAHLSTAKASSEKSTESAGSAPKSAASPEQQMLAYSKCMRANGVPNFPDPSPSGGGFKLPPGMSPDAPSLQTARTKCQKLNPAAGITSGPPPSAQTLERFLKISQCMRKHGVAEFPDPTTPASVPRNPFSAGINEISNIEGVILLFPRTINQQAPVFIRVATSCGFPLHNH